LLLYIGSLQVAVSLDKLTEVLASRFGQIEFPLNMINLIMAQSFNVSGVKGATFVL
jgi:hypothetical protein